MLTEIQREKDDRKRVEGYGYQKKAGKHRNRDNLRIWGKKDPQELCTRNSCIKPFAGFMTDVFFWFISLQCRYSSQLRLLILAFSVYCLSAQSTFSP